MKSITYEKLFPEATFEELWAGRKPIFRAINEQNSLKRRGISARLERFDYRTTSVLVDAPDDDQKKLLIERGYAIKKVRKPRKKKYSDVVKTILKRPRNGTGGGIPLTRGEVAMLFLDGYAGDHPNLLDIRSQGYGEDSDWDGLTTDDVLEDNNTAFVWSKWEPLELWLDESV